MKGIVATIILCLLMSSQAFGEYRIATVDINRVLNETEDSQKEKEQLDKASEVAKKKVENEREKLKDLEEEMRSKGVKPGSKEAETFREKAREYQRVVSNTQEDLRRTFLKSNQKLTERVLEVVNDYAKKNDIDLVLEKSENARSAVLFRKPSADITDEVVDILND